MQSLTPVIDSPELLDERKERIIFLYTIYEK